MDDAEYEAEQKRIADLLVNDQRVGFLAQELGFPPHTKIQAVVKHILAMEIAKIMIPYLAGRKPSP